MRSDTPKQESILATLRHLVPERTLSFAEALRITELQANRLLELQHVEGPFVPSEVVSLLPRIEVVYEADLPVSGSAHWERGRWVITLNSSEPESRQRFSLMHEYGHIVHHPIREHLYGDPAEPASADRAERLADAFAASVLMPKRWLKWVWADSNQNLVSVSARLGVSPRALSVRLYHLGLGVESPRCPRTSQSFFPRRRTYLRYTPKLEVAA